ncbi:MAG: hypothetical protein WB973_01930 [Thermoanaerobaculia bacterium]
MGTAAASLLTALSSWDDDVLAYSLVIGGAVPSLSTEPLEPWIDCIDLAVIATPTSAVLGKLETDVLRRLAKDGRAFAVVILGSSGVTAREREEFLVEVERFTLPSLREELGPFPVFVMGQVSEAQEGVEDLRQWIAEHVEDARTLQLTLVATSWLEEMRSTAALRVAEDSVRASWLDHVERHLREHVVAVSEATDDAHLHLVNEVSAHMDKLDGGCASVAEAITRWLLENSGGRQTALATIERTWQQVVNELHCARVAAAIDRRISEDCRQFCRAYADVVPEITVPRIVVPADAVVFDGNALLDRVEQMAGEYESRYVTGPFREATRKIPSKDLQAEIEKALLDIVTTDGRLTVDRFLRQLADVELPRFSGQMHALLDVFEREAEASIQRHRDRLTGQRLKNAVDDLRGRWDRIAASLRAVRQ